MKNQRGVTLVELLVVIVIMGAIFTPISIMLINSLETEKEVSMKNDTQREARFIMEYITEKMRDSNIEWTLYDQDTINNSKKLIDHSIENETKELLNYEKKENGRGIIVIEGHAISEDVKEFTVTENDKLITVKLIIEKSGNEFELQSEIIHSNQIRY